MDEDGDVDLLAYKNAKENYKRKKEEDEIEEKANKKKTRPFARRKRHPRIDPKTSAWWHRYVIDENKTWRDVNHRDGKLFALRFSLDFVSVKELTDKISEPEHNFWRNDYDHAGKIIQSIIRYMVLLYYLILSHISSLVIFFPLACLFTYVSLSIPRIGQESSPRALLVLGSLRLLTRNVTLDDLYEQTNISGEVHRCFFKKFMRWYATVVFPKVVKMPKLEELDNNGAEYKSAGFNGAALSVDCVHIRLWNVSANLKQVFMYIYKYESK